MIVKTSYSLIMMVTLDFASLEECQKASTNMYNKNRCFENFNYYIKEPLKVPENFIELLYKSKTIQ